MTAGRVEETFEVDPRKAPALSDAISQLAATAQKRAIGPITMDSLRRNPSSLLIEITSPTPAIGHYELIAKISHMKGKRVFVHPLSRASLDFNHIRKNHADGRCDHCGVRRKRRLVYLLRDVQDREVQVGSSCLKEYVGSSDPRKALIQADLFAQARELAIAAAPEPNPEQPRRGWPTVLEYLAEVAAVIRHEGAFVRKVDVTADETSTADLALRNFRLSQDGEDSIEVLPEDRDLARRRVDEFRQRIGREKKISGFDQRLLAVLAKDVAWPENQGIIATVFERVVSLRRHQRSNGSRSGDWLGEKGETLTVTAMLRKVGEPSDTKYGPQYPHFFLTESSDWVTWWATNIQLKEGGRYELTGEIKRLDERRGHKVTVLTGCRTSEIQ